MRGRPVKTDIRQRIGAILSYTGCAYGYEIYKIYKDIFDKTSLRNIYYNLKKGLSTGEFIIIEAKREPGEFTWGMESEHIYYGLGPYTIPSNLTEKQRLKLELLKKKEINIDWLKEISNKIDQLDQNIANFLATNQRMRYEDSRKLNELFKINSAKLKDWAAQKFDKEQTKEISSKINEIIKKLK